MRPVLRTLALTTALAVALPGLSSAPLQAQTAPVTAPATAAEPSTTLVADRVELTGENTIVASGAVEVVHEGSVLLANRITYQRDTGSLLIDGPLTLFTPTGEIVLGSQAELSSDMQNGILRSARLMIERELQVAATEMQRVDGRHIVLSRAIASSCEVCAENPTPLWEIRARRVIHDTEEQQIYFDEAQLRILGLPVLWLPHLRAPGPGLNRARGFLTPRFLDSSNLGFGIETPYFIPIGDHKDVTLLPMLTTKGARQLGLIYRQAFVNGDLTFAGALASDNSRDDPRGYLQLDGGFDLPRGFRLQFAGLAVSDRDYLNDYRADDRSRLDSHITVSRVNRDELIFARLGHYHSVDSTVRNPDQPQLMADLGVHRRFDLPRLGGRAMMNFQLHAHRRSSNENVIGRDLNRATLETGWRRDWLLPAGMVTGLEARLTTDRYQIRQDSRYPSAVTLTTPAVMAEFRWPFARNGADGSRDVIEPVIQAVWSKHHLSGRVPNSDSLYAELDESNLLSFSRFPGVDRREGGRRIHAALNWDRTTAAGSAFSASMGRIFRFSAENQFAAGSGLNGSRSDWVSAVHLKLHNGIYLNSRILFDDRLDLTRGTLLAGIERDRYGLSSAVIWADEGRTYEGLFSGRLRLAANWNAWAHAKYNIKTRTASETGFGLEFLNDCARLNIGVSRKYWNGKPSSNMTMTLDLLGFGGTPAPAGRAGSCAF